MKDFFYLEGAYIIFSLIILIITAFIATRPFMKKNILKKSILIVGTFLAVAIFMHYFVTTKRMQNVKKAFLNGEKIICENRLYTKGANFIEIYNNGIWKLKDNNFINPNYTRKFFIARCFVK